MSVVQRLKTWYSHKQEVAYKERERKFTIENIESHQNGEYVSRALESFMAPPPFEMYLWSTFPLLFIATQDFTAIIAGVIATIINFVIIHLDMVNIVKYIFTTIVLLALVFLYHFGVF